LTLYEEAGVAEAIVPGPAHPRRGVEGELNPAGPGADPCWMDPRSETALRGEREAQFIANIGAFMRRDFDAIERSMRPDVVMELPGSSWLSGTYGGFAQVGRCVVALRRVLESDHTRISFLHEGDQMIVRHDIKVHGPNHDVEMTLRVRARFDEQGKTESLTVEPDDLGLFDHVLNAVLRDSEAS
jgi:hypothetical protein